MELAIIMLLCLKKLFVKACFILRSFMISFRLNKNAKKVSGMPVFFCNYLSEWRGKSYNRGISSTDQTHFLLRRDASRLYGLAGYC